MVCNGYVKNEKFNDFSNAALTTRIAIFVRKLWYSKCRSNEHLFVQCSSRDLQFKTRIKHNFAVETVIIYSILTNKQMIDKQGLTICCNQQTKQRATVDHKNINLSFPVYIITTPYYWTPRGSRKGPIKQGLSVLPSVLPSVRAFSLNHIINFF